MRWSLLALVAVAVAYAFAPTTGSPARADCAACQVAVQADVRADEAIYSALAANDATFTLTGTVQGVAFTPPVIEVMAAGVKQSVHVTPTTSIEKNGETVSIAEIRVGSHVTVSGVVRDGQHVAVSIQIK